MSFELFNNVMLALRALVTHVPSSIINVLRKYKKTQGFLLPHRRLGFATPEEFIRATGEYNMSKRGNEVFISAKFDEDATKQTREKRIRELMLRQSLIKFANRGTGRRRG
ncbi:uncharacterized protein [Drosophila kikkawai]|uniref:Uncharacterized protein n=1 Tax=Drosophila kikkawai TaxID=30033 RepID=A0A6P4IKW4_DROKI|nr:uncharacterized protein LOC108076022 [Drosophila kikkawai]KAH8344993.1 hypothetical protein KR059_000071 [Drosophila kikkawai]